MFKILKKKTETEKVYTENNLTTKPKYYSSFYMTHSTHQFNCNFYATSSSLKLWRIVAKFVIFVKITTFLLPLQWSFRKNLTKFRQISIFITLKYTSSSKDLNVNRNQCSEFACIFYQIICISTLVFRA